MQAATGTAGRPILEDDPLGRLIEGDHTSGQDKATPSARYFWSRGSPEM